MARKPDTSDLLMLRRKKRVSGWYEIGWRVAGVAALIGILILFHWLEREGLKDTHDGHVSFLDVVYFTMISVTTTGYGDIAPVTDNTRMFDALVVTPIRILFLLIFVGSAYLLVAKSSWERFLMNRIQGSLRDHTVVVGYGTKNTRAVAELIALGATPANIVVADLDEERLEHAKAAGCTVLRADATLEETLKALRVERAKLVIVSAGRDDTSILVCLTTRHLAPHVRISVAINHQNNEVPAKLAGADVVVNPLNFAGLLLATTHSGQHIADYLADLATIGGRVRLVEREVRSEEVGRPLREIKDTLGLRIIREGKAYGFWRPQVQELQPGDVIMEIQPTVD